MSGALHTTEGAHYITTRRVTPIIPANPLPSDESERIYMAGEPLNDKLVQEAAERERERRAFLWRVSEAGIAVFVVLSLAYVIGGAP